MPNPIKPLATAVATVITVLITTLFTTGLVVTVMANTMSVQQKKAPVSGYRVVKVYPHDRQAFTQGLQYVDGVLYEGTGQTGQSGIRKVKLETGEVMQHQPLDAKYFGEGITVWNNTIVQLTWQSEIGFVYDKATFKQTKTFTYPGEGWGLTHDGARLIMSDGSAVIRFLDPASFKEIGRVTVRENGVPVKNLNELEYVKGEILANVWTDGSSRADFTEDRGYRRVGRSVGAPRSARGCWHRRPERHRLRRGGGPAVCDGEVVAEAV